MQDAAALELLLSALYMLMPQTVPAGRRRSQVQEDSLMRYGHTYANVDCEFCSRRATIRSHFGDTGDPIRCCAYCYHLMKSLAPVCPWRESGSRQNATAALSDAAGPATGSDSPAEEIAANPS